MLYGNDIPIESINEYSPIIRIEIACQGLEMCEWGVGGGYCS